MTTRIGLVTLWKHTMRMRTDECACTYDLLNRICCSLLGSFITTAPSESGSCLIYCIGKRSNKTSRSRHIRRSLSLVRVTEVWSNGRSTYVRWRYKFSRSGERRGMYARDELARVRAGRRGGTIVRFQRYDGGHTLDFGERVNRHLAV